MKAAKPQPYTGLQVVALRGEVSDLRQENAKLIAEKAEQVMSLTHNVHTSLPLYLSLSLPAALL